MVRLADRDAACRLLAGGPPCAGLIAWTDDREWISRWRTAGRTLAEREPVLRAWLEAAPPRPLPRGLPAVELARVARDHGLIVEVETREACRARAAERP